MQSALTSPPDGYTIVFVGPNNAINTTFYEKVPFDFIRDSAPVAGTMRLTNVMEVQAGARSLAGGFDSPKPPSQRMEPVLRRIT